MDSEVSPLGYAASSTVSIRDYLPPGRGFRPSLCFSDTHLLPSEEHFGLDIPEELCELLEFYSDHQVFILGDFLESLVLPPRKIQSLSRAPRLSALLDDLRRRKLRFIPGNHDLYAIGFLAEFFGSACLFPGGFRVANVVFVHGHELGLDTTAFAGRLPGAVHLGGSLERLGIGLRVGMAHNSEIAAQYMGRRLFPVFGHTHVAEATPRFANSGCFLKDSRSYITIRHDTLTLWQGAP